MLSYTDALNMPAGQMTVTTLSGGDDVECTYADAGTSSSVNCKKKAAQAVPSGTKILLPAATSITPAASELAPQPATNSLLTPATNAANPANPAAELTDTTSKSIAAEEPLATNTAVPDEDYPLEQPAESDVTLPADNAVLPAEDASVEDYPAEEPADATATNALPADNTVVPAEDYPEEEPADATAVNTLPAADAVAPVEDVPVEEPAADVAGNTITNAVPAGNTAVPVVPTPVADPAVAANVPALGGDYNVASAPLATRLVASRVQKPPSASP
jgi:nicotinate-nucleotide--dimethylbenzimidazole phosphoribosyltransferase